MPIAEIGNILLCRVSQQDAAHNCTVGAFNLL